MNTLLTMVNAGDRAAVAETNAGRIDASLAFMRVPTPVSGSPNTIKGPPTAGAWVTGMLWVDTLLGIWLCTAGGTPGTWVQIEPAPVASDPSGCPSGYLTVRTDLNLERKVYGGSSWTFVLEPIP